jgi:hypothetical protein
MLCAIAMLTRERERLIVVDFHGAHLAFDAVSYGAAIDDLLELCWSCRTPRTSSRRCFTGGARVWMPRAEAT